MNSIRPTDRSMQQQQQQQQQQTPNSDWKDCN
jgi:hypothetical protein